MSLNLRITLLLAVAPFLTFWGLQIGVGLVRIPANVNTHSG
jgi:hypothetical protein